MRGGWTAGFQHGGPGVAVEFPGIQVASPTDLRKSFANTLLTSGLNKVSRLSIHFWTFSPYTFLTRAGVREALNLPQCIVKGIPACSRFVHTAFANSCVFSVLMPSISRTQVGSNFVKPNSACVPFTKRTVKVIGSTVPKFA